MGNNAAVTQQVITHYWWCFSLDVKLIASQTAVKFRGQVLIGTLNEEPIVTLSTVHLQGFDPCQFHEKSCTENPFIGDHKIVSELGAHNNYRVETISTAYVYRSVHRILSEVRPLIT